MTDSTAESLAPRFCLGCRYDLQGIDLDPAVCPECGKAFDVGDPSTFASVLRPPWLERLVTRYGPPLAIVLLVITACMHTLLPCPAKLGDWRLWIWLNKRYGVEATWFYGERGRLYWWGDRITSAQGHDARGAPLWKVTWDWPDQWHAQGLQPGVRRRAIMGAFTDMKREMFGVMVGEADRETLEETFEVRGSKVDVFAELVHRFGIKLTPFLLREDQPHIWLLHPETGRLTAVSRDQAREWGVEVGVARSGERSEPLIAMPKSTR